MQQLVFWIGLGLAGALELAGLELKLRDDVIITKVTVLTAILGVFGFALRSDALEMGAANAADWLWCPFIYITAYAFLRFLYKRTYHREPTYNRSSWYDPNDRRRQNSFDVAVHIVPIILSMSGPLLFHYLSA
jgi:hypothetical protein